MRELGRSRSRNPRSTRRIDSRYDDPCSGARSRTLQVVHSTSAAPAGWRARVAGSAEESLLARRDRSSKRLCHGAHPALLRRQARAIPAAVPSPARAVVLTGANAALLPFVLCTRDHRRRRGWCSPGSGAGRSFARRRAKVSPPQISSISTLHQRHLARRTPAQSRRCTPGARG